MADFLNSKGLGVPLVVGFAIEVVIAVEAKAFQDATGHAAANDAGNSPSSTDKPPGETL